MMALPVPTTMSMIIERRAIMVPSISKSTAMRSKRVSERRGLVVGERAFQIAGFPIFDRRWDPVSGLDLDVGVGRRQPRVLDVLQEGVRRGPQLDRSV